MHYITGVMSQQDAFKVSKVQKDILGVNIYIKKYFLSDSSRKALPQLL